MHCVSARKYDYGRKAHGEQEENEEGDDEGGFQYGSSSVGYGAYAAEHEGEDSGLQRRRTIFGEPNRIFRDNCCSDKRML